MGMFDYFHIEFNIDKERDLKDCEFQTKDFDDPSCEHYYLKSDGCLWTEVCNYVDKETDPIVVTGYRKVKEFSGHVNVYTDDFYIDIPGVAVFRSKEWREYLLVFEDGVLVRYERVS